MSSLLNLILLRCGVFIQLLNFTANKVFLLEFLFCTTYMLPSLPRFFIPTGTLLAAMLGGPVLNKTSMSCTDLKLTGEVSDFEKNIILYSPQTLIFAVFKMHN